MKSHSKRALRIALFGAATTLIAAWPGGLADAHDDGPAPKVGEYRVTLNSVTIKAFSAGFLGDPNPDVIIKTFTQAETHDGQVALFGPYPDVGAGTVFPQVIPVGKLIYWHVDCVPSEDLQLVLDLYDQDGGLGDLVKKIIERGQGIVTSKNPALGAAAGAAADALTAAITAELNKEGRFPQWASGSIAGATTPFSFGDNSGTWNLRLGGSPSRNFTASVTFQYLERNVVCDAAGITSVINTIKNGDNAVKDLFRRLGDADNDGHTDQTEEALGSNPNVSSSTPEHRLALTGNPCVDGLDNDGDGLTDLNDPGCVAVDLDIDGVADDVDNCPGLANSNQVNTDQDGLGDACDPSPTDPILGVPDPLREATGSFGVPALSRNGALLLAASLALCGLLLLWMRRSGT
jgi:hypothetical protein